jgi:hypothetical protein
LWKSKKLKFSNKILNLSNEFFFCPNTPAVWYTVHSVAEEAEVFPVGLDGPGFSFFEWIGVVREVVGFDFPYFGDKSIFVYFDIE